MNVIMFYLQRRSRIRLCRLTIDGTPPVLDSRRATFCEWFLIRGDSRIHSEPQWFDRNENVYTARRRMTLQRQQ